MLYSLMYLVWRSTSSIKTTRVIWSFIKEKVQQIIGAAGDELLCLILNCIDLLNVFMIHDSGVQRKEACRNLWKKEPGEALKMYISRICIHCFLTF